MKKNKRGNLIERNFILHYDRYIFDFKICTRAKGWEQYDTKQDASYFGVWVNARDRKIKTFAEGDLKTVTCPTVESFKAELKFMAEFYGDPPPAFKIIDNEGNLTELYDQRPA